MTELLMYIKTYDAEFINDDKYNLQINGFCKTYIENGITMVRDIEVDNVLFVKK